MMAGHSVRSSVIEMVSKLGLKWAATTAGLTVATTELHMAV